MLAKRRPARCGSSDEDEVDIDQGEGPVVNDVLLLVIVLVLVLENLKEVPLPPGCAPGGRAPPPPHQRPARPAIAPPPLDVAARPGTLASVSRRTIHSSAPVRANGQHSGRLIRVVWGWRHSAAVRATPASPFAWHPTVAEGKEYIRASDVAAFYRFDRHIEEGWATWFRSPTLAMRWEVDTSVLVVNDTKFILSSPVLEAGRRRPGVARPIW